MKSLVPVQVQGGKRMHTCALRPTGVYGDGDELIRDFYKQCVQRGGVAIHGVPEHIEHGRVYVGETDAAAVAFYMWFQLHRSTPASSLQPLCSPSAARLRPVFPLCVWFSSGSLDEQRSTF